MIERVVVGKVIDYGQEYRDLRVICDDGKCRIFHDCTEYQIDTQENDEGMSRIVVACFSERVIGEKGISVVNDVDECLSEELLPTLEIEPMLYVRMLLCSLLAERNAIAKSNDVLVEALKENLNNAKEYHSLECGCDKYMGRVCNGHRALGIWSMDNEAIRSTETFPKR